MDPKVNSFDYTNGSIDSKFFEEKIPSSEHLLIMIQIFYSAKKNIEITVNEAQEKIYKTVRKGTRTYFVTEIQFKRCFEILNHKNEEWSDFIQEIEKNGKNSQPAGIIRSSDLLKREIPSQRPPSPLSSSSPYILNIPEDRFDDHLHMTLSPTISKSPSLGDLTSSSKDVTKVDRPQINPSYKASSNSALRHKEEGAIEILKTALKESASNNAITFTFESSHSSMKFIDMLGQNVTLLHSEGTKIYATYFDHFENKEEISMINGLRFFAELDLSDLKLSEEILIRIKAFKNAIHERAIEQSVRCTFYSFNEFLLSAQYSDRAKFNPLLKQISFWSAGKEYQIYIENGILKFFSESERTVRRIPENEALLFLKELDIAFNKEVQEGIDILIKELLNRGSAPNVSTSSVERHSSSAEDLAVPDFLSTLMEQEEIPFEQYLKKELIANLSTLTFVFEADRSQMKFKDSQDKNVTLNYREGFLIEATYFDQKTEKEDVHLFNCLFFIVSLEQEMSKTFREEANQTFKIFTKRIEMNVKERSARWQRYSFRSYLDLASWSRRVEFNSDSKQIIFHTFQRENKIYVENGKVYIESPFEPTMSRVMIPENEAFIFLDEVDIASNRRLQDGIAILKGQLTQ